MPPRTTRQTPTKQEAPTFEIKPGKDCVIDYFTMLLYGQAGRGKTYFADMFPGKTLIIGLDNGLKTIPNTTADFVSVTSCSQLKGIFQAVRDNKYDLVIFDHISMLQDMVLKEVLGLSDMPIQVGWGDATMQQYGTRGIRMKTYLEELLRMRTERNVILIAQQDTFESEKNGDLIKPKVNAGISEKLLKWIDNRVDFAFQAYTRPKLEVSEKTVGKVVIRKKDPVLDDYDRPVMEYCLRVGQDPMYYTKFRGGGPGLPHTIVDPTYEKFQQCVNGTYTESQEEGE